MDDLSSVTWTASKTAALPNGSAQGSRPNYYPALHPTPPLSGRSTPSNLVPDGAAPKPPSSVPSGSISSTPVNDSFANLVNFNNVSQPTKGLSLQEQQRVLQEQKTKQEDERRRQFNSHFGMAQNSPRSLQVSGRSTPNRAMFPPTYRATEEYGGQKLSKLINKPFAGIPNGFTHAASETTPEDDADVPEALKALEPVDRSSHMPAVSDSWTSADKDGYTKGTSIIPPLGGVNTEGVNPANGGDDDPFGLGPAHSPNTAGSKADEQAQDNDDDVLGLLSRPLSEFPKLGPGVAVDSKLPPTTFADSLDRAIAELVDMGFPPEMSKAALQSTESGTDVQAAVGWLLNQAYEDSRKEKQRQNGGRGDSSGEQHARTAPSRRKSSSSGAPRPAWMREQGRTGPTQHRSQKKLPSKDEKDPTQLASELGSNLFKTANSLWKTGAKRLNQAVADFNGDADPSQPKWMREVPGDAVSRKPRSQQNQYNAHNHDRMGAGETSRKPPVAQQPSVTDEALLLESVDVRPPQMYSTRRKADTRSAPKGHSVDQPNPMPGKYMEPAPQQPKFMQQSQARDYRARLNRRAVEDEAAQAYISPARRKKPAPKVTLVEPEPDLLSDTSKEPSPSLAPKCRNTETGTGPPRLSPGDVHPTNPPYRRRSIPPVSPSALRQSTLARQGGTAAFKRGDYAQATPHYTAALSALPSSHPLAIPVLTNRALSHLKTGDPKACLADVRTTLEIIGRSRGTGETVDLGDGEGAKSMNIYWAKAMTRQAEAYEQLERWSDAAASWRTCVEAGVGGAASIAGRNRCENATKPKPAGPVKKPALRPGSRPFALKDFVPSTAQSTEAVNRLRAANAAADKLDDEKFALADQVDARVMKWRAGKEGNLRALLSSLESVLWEDAGWKKVGMGDVLLPNKVKIVYMKGIAKVHPDKLSPKASTEEKMISAAVFATLNEAWEKFKQENGL
ncbi:MAG: hypothetical protein Q9163_004638 [Psora crenata]